MQLPIKFPSDADVIAEETARYRALSPDQQFEHFRGILSTGAWMIEQSPKAAFIRKYTEEQEELAMRAVKEFFNRHAF